MPPVVPGITAAMGWSSGRTYNDRWFFCSAENTIVRPSGEAANARRFGRPATPPMEIGRRDRQLKACDRSAHGRWRA